MAAAAERFAGPLTQALVDHDARLHLREETAQDADFIVALYADTRWEELRPVDWPDTAKRDFLAQQSRLQSAHYREHYPGAEFLLILRDEVPIGRLYLRAGVSEVRLMDIALLAVDCGRGIGGVLVRALQALVQQRGLQLTLHVEPANPAQRLYQRLGFGLIENRGIYDFLGWPAAPRA